MRAVSQDLDFADAYRLAADAFDQLHRADEAAFFRSQALCLSGGGSDPALAAQVGLHKIIALGSPAFPVLTPYQNALLIGTRDGRLFAIDPYTLALRQLAVTPDEIDRLDSTKTSLQVSDNATPRNIHPLFLPPDLNDPKPRSDELWNRRSGYDGYTVFYRDSYYRPTPKGVLQFDPAKNQTVLHPMPIAPESADSGKRWDIRLNPSAPHFGFGVGGITVLNKNLCPEKWLVHQATGSVSHLLTSPNDLCALCFAQDKHPQMSIYSHTGQLIRAADTSGLSYWSQSGQLIRLNGGYLLCGMELLYLHPDPNVPVIRIARPEDKTLRSIDPAWRDRFDFFGPPLIVNDQIFTVSRDGCVYVFNADFFGRPRP